MAQTLFTVVVFIALLAAAPFLIKRIQQQRANASGLGGSASKLISAIAVGPHQRVVTVEVGPDHARSWLVLGVTGQNIVCLHTVPAHGGTPPAPGSGTSFSDVQKLVSPSEPNA